MTDDDPLTPAPGPIDAPVDAPVDDVVTDAELRALGARARATDDAALRRLVLGYVTLRRTTADVLAFIEAREGGAAVGGTPLLLRARQLVQPPRG